MLVQEPNDSAVLARTELVELVNRQLEVAFGNPKPGRERARVREIVDVDFCRTETGFTALAS